VVFAVELPKDVAQRMAQPVLRERREVWEMGHHISIGDRLAELRSLL
jgi:hypothetical protein